jgi:hypothetical protein
MTKTQDTVPTAALAEAVEIIKALYLDGQCRRDETGGCLEHDHWELDPEDECPHHQAQVFLEAHQPSRTQAPATSAER